MRFFTRCFPIPTSPLSLIKNEPSLIKLTNQLLVILSCGGCLIRLGFIDGLFFRLLIFSKIN